MPKKTTESQKNNQPKNTTTKKSPEEISKILNQAIENTDWDLYWRSVESQVQDEVAEYAKARTRSYEKNIQFAVA